jgi:NADPH:quinone reductase-like Zn-dependent oxidoreductase
MGRYAAPPGFPQDIPGLEFAGEVAEIGREVRSLRVGQRVFGITGGGAQAEYTIVPEGALAEIPRNLSWAEAAAVPEAFITAHDALFTQAHLQMGERLLIHAVGSGIGLAAAQLAHAIAARVYGTSRNADKLERSREYGMDEGIAVGDNPAVVSERIKELTGGAGVNIVLDLLGAAYLGANLAALGKRGRLMLVGTMAGNNGALDLSAVMSKRISIVGTMLRARSAEEKATATRLFAQHVVPLLASGVVRPVVDKVYSMNEVREAHERMESNENFGKIVLMIDQGQGQ